MKSQPFYSVNPAIAYLFWCLGFFGICGIQRLYAGKIVSGLFYLCTFGIFGIGQFIDLFLIPGMVDSRNAVLLRRSNRHLYDEPELKMNQTIRSIPLSVEATSQVPAKTRSPMQKLLQAAKEHQGKLSIAQAALYTDLEPEQVKKLLEDAVRFGYAEITNDPTTGAIRYHFDI